MKKKILFLPLIGLFLLMSCDDNNDSNKIEPSDETIEVNNDNDNNNNNNPNNNSTDTPDNNNNTTDNNSSSNNGNVNNGENYEDDGDTWIYKG